MTEFILSGAGITGLFLSFFGLKIKEKRHEELDRVYQFKNITERERNRLMIEKISEQLEKEFGNDLVSVFDHFRASQIFVAKFSQDERMQDEDTFIDMARALAKVEPLFCEVDTNEYNEEIWR